MASLAKIVNVILVENGQDREYYTLEGILIGGFKGGTPIDTRPAENEVEQAGDVVRGKSPKEVRRDGEKKNDKTLTSILKGE